MENGKKSSQDNLFDTATETEQINKSENQSNKINLLDVVAGEAAESVLEVVRLGSDESAVIPFTADSEAVDLHYCPESEISGYVVCNGPDCVLCRIGRKREQRLLLPVYLPAAGSVGILPVSRSLRPFALLPQISNVLKAGKPMVMFVTREGAKYTVSTAELRKDVDGGEEAIKHFLDDSEAGLHRLADVYPRIDNEQLASVEEIARMMALKGVRVNAGDQRS
ncbi:MAG: hypothetical protein M0Q52_11560 [Lascolabacillus sp.]|jgi:hypothetical protein|nr:hypothetical protein [Lascolabacillus sp.]